MRVLYLSGPVNADLVFKRWLNKTSETGFFGTVFLEDLLDICREYDAELLVVTTNPGERALNSQDWCTVLNAPIASSSSGLAYHSRNIFWTLRLFPVIARFRPTLIVATAMRDYWFVLSILKFFGVKFVPALHGALRPKFGREKLSHRVLSFLNSVIFRHYATQMLVASYDIKRQLMSRYAIPSENIHDFKPIYNRERFENFVPASFDDPTRVILYCGRIERNKGVFDVLEVARQLEILHPGSYRFHFCGAGSALPELLKEVSAKELSKAVMVHGHCNVEQLQSRIAESHIFIVPTRAELTEGFNMVCAEAVMSLRPVVTSAVCPALEYIRESAVEVPPDSVDGYRDAIINLANDPNLYNAKVAACRIEREQFFDKSHSYGAVLSRILSRIL